MRIVLDRDSHLPTTAHTSFAMETNQFQQFLSDELKHRSALASVYVPVEDIHQSTDKLGRIQSLQPLIHSGMLRLCRRHVTLLEQLWQFPLGAHDDGRGYDPLLDDELWDECG